MHDISIEKKDADRSCFQASMFEPDPQVTFFGHHYARLKSIKRVYDPNDLFVVIEGVGADEWDKELKCRL